MRILHTSDWHIGKKTENFDRLPEQAAVLDEIADIADRENVQIVLVAGDVFDTFIPSAEAESLFFEKIKKISENRAVVVIAGNHDDATRLCSAAPLAAKHGIYFSDAAYTLSDIEYSASLGRDIRLTECRGGGFVFQSRAGEQVYIGALSYPTEARFRVKSTGESHAEKIREWLQNTVSGNGEKLPQIIVSHLFTVGGVTTGGEREISLGGAKAVDISDFPDSQYVALGHLHKRQVFGREKNVVYSGSILQYSFDEVNTEKSVTVFDISCRAENIRAIPLSAGRKLAKLTAASVEQALNILPMYREHLTELTLKLRSPMTREENNFLHSEFPNVISLKLEVEGSVRSEVKGRKQLGDDRLFEECYKKTYGDKPSEELMRLYLSLLEEVSAK